MGGECVALLPLSATRGQCELMLVKHNQGETSVSADLDLICGIKTAPCSNIHVFPLSHYLHESVIDLLRRLYFLPQLKQRCISHLHRPTDSLSKPTHWARTSTMSARVGTFGPTLCHCALVRRHRRHFPQADAPGGRKCCQGTCYANMLIPHVYTSSWKGTRHWSFCSRVAQIRRIL